MTLPVHSRRLRPLALATGLALTLVQPAQAALSGPVSVSLIAPGGDMSGSPAFVLSQLVNPAVGIEVGDGSDIGNYMLGGEEIRFVDNSIRLHVAAGWDDVDTGELSTGILGQGADTARYEFSDLAIAGQVIVGFNLYAFDGYATSGSSGVLSGTSASLLSSTQLSFGLDALRFVSRSNGTSNAYGEFRIDLLTQPVPEPASWALMLIGLAGCTQLARRAKARSQAA